MRRLQRAQAGVSLIELMVALTIGSLLIVGTITVYSTSRSTFAVNEAIARLQEQGRFAMTVLEPDIELAGYYGFTNAADTLLLVRGSNPGTVLATAASLRQRPLPPLAPEPRRPPGVADSVHACGTNFALDVLTPVEGSNDGFELGPASTADCEAFGAGAVAGADTLTVRRASTTTSAPAAGRVQLLAARLRSRTAQMMFADGNAPMAPNIDHQIHDLVVRTYYLSRDSDDRADLPSLRMKALAASGGTPRFVDTELLVGVEDLQVQFGIDTGDYDNDGVVDPGADADDDGTPETDGRATRYVNPDFPGLDRSQVVAVRLWLRLRSERAEPGFVDARTYRYADVEYTPAGAEQGFRRLLLSRTITLRNARTL
jgi:type IV pilus assembly protein PilW